MRRLSKILFENIFCYANIRDKVHLHFPITLYIISILVPTCGALSFTINLEKVRVVILLSVLKLCTVTVFDLKLVPCNTGQRRRRPDWAKERAVDKGTGRRVFNKF